MGPEIAFCQKKKSFDGRVSRVFLAGQAMKEGVYAIRCSQN